MFLLIYFFPPFFLIIIFTITWGRSDGGFCRFLLYGKKPFENLFLLMTKIFFLGFDLFLWVITILFLLFILLYIYLNSLKYAQSN